jgi:hypothetical protein
VLALIALAPRAALLAAGPLADPARAVTDDSVRYLSLADNLRRFGTFAKAHEDGRVHEALARLRAANGTLPPADEHGLRPEEFRTPGYPAFLALAATWDVRVALVCQCLLGAALAPAVAAVALGFGLSRRAAFVAGLVWALHPGLVVFDCLLLTESLFNACVVAALLAAARARAWPGWLASGLGLGAAGLVRPLGALYLPFVLALAWQRGQLRWRVAALLALAALAPPGLWACRNRAVGGGLRVATVGSVNLLFYTAAYAISEERGEDWLGSWPARVDELADRLGERVGPGEDVFAAADRLALEELAARPGPAARVVLKSSAKLAVDHSLGDAARLLGLTYRPTGLFSRLVLGGAGGGGGSAAAAAAALAWTGLNAALALAALVGLARAARGGPASLALACGVTILLFTAATASVGLERMRLPIMPAVCLLVGRAAGGRPAAGDT